MPVDVQNPNTRSVANATGQPFGLQRVMQSRIQEVDRVRQYIKTHYFFEGGAYPIPPGGLFFRSFNGDSHIYVLELSKFPIIEGLSVCLSKNYFHEGRFYPIPRGGTFINNKYVFVLGLMPNSH